eukprot:5504901-Alexandrium_andersonii.AAC.1
MPHGRTLPEPSEGRPHFAQAPAGRPPRIEHGEVRQLLEVVAPVASRLTRRCAKTRSRAGRRPALLA